jgi:hypothetical protein
MSFFKYIERLKLIHSYLEKGQTGNGDEFAKKVGISRSVLMEHIQELRETFNAPIDFSRKERTFFYTSPFKLTIEITNELDKIKGGYGLINYRPRVPDSIAFILQMQL